MANPKLDEKQTALAFGTFFALVHVAWSALVAANVAAGFHSWLVNLHFISVPITYGAFNAMTAAWLILVAFIAGYAIGHVFATIWNWAAKK